VENSPNKEMIELFDYVVRSLGTAVKNSALYQPSHPVFESSIKNLKVSMDNWFVASKDLAIGITQGNILLNGEYVKEKDIIYAEVANYLHARGILTIEVHAAVTNDELTAFLSIIKETPRFIRENGGVSKIMAGSPNLEVKEIDYSAVLVSGGGGEEATGEDHDVWKSLCGITDESKNGKLPSDKVEFLTDFLRDSKRSASVLNRIYKQAVGKVENEKGTIEDIKSAILKMSQYFDKESGKDSRMVRKRLADIVSQLDPGLVVNVLDKGAGKEDLAKEITKNFTDDMFGDFITSLISSEGGMNENLLRIFDKMLPEDEKNRSGNIATLVTDNLLQSGAMDKDSLAQFQLSIKEIFKGHPGNSFVSQVYKLTLDTFAGESTQSSASNSELMLLVRDFKKSFDDAEMGQEKIRLMLNVLWLENEVEEIEKLTDIALGYFNQTIGDGDIRNIKRYVEFFTEKVRPEQKKDPRAADSIERAVGIVTGKDVVRAITSFVPDAEDDTLDDIAYIVGKTGHEGKDAFLDAFISEDNPFSKDRFKYIFIKIGKDISREILIRLNTSDFESKKDFLKILRIVDSETAQSVTSKLLEDSNPRIRLEALQNYVLRTDAEKKDMWDKFRKEKDEHVKNHMLQIITASRDWNFIEDIMRELEKDPWKMKYRIALVKGCGDNRIAASIGYLEKILNKKALFATAMLEELKIAAVVSLGQIRTPECLDIVTKARNTKIDSVKKMCELVLRLGERDTRTDQR